MYKHILIATDGSELARKAVAQGLGLAKALSARVTVVTITEPWTAVVPGEMGLSFPIEDYEVSVASSAAVILGAAKGDADKSSVKIETRHVADQYPADGIISAAKACGADLIVMASHGRRGISRLLIGSQANQVVVHSDIPVLIVR